MDAELHRSNVLDAHPNMRVARGNFLQQAEFRFRRFLSDPERQPLALVCLHFNDWIWCRDRFGFADPEALNLQIDRRVVLRLGRKDICARFGDAAMVMVVTIDSETRDIETRARGLLTPVSGQPLNVGQPPHVTFSIGLRRFDRRVRSAEEAMFDAVHPAELIANRRENAVRVFRPERQESDPRDGQNVRQTIRKSLQTHRMRRIFQPLPACDDSGLRYLQAWSRLLAEDGGDVRARGFIDVARRNRLLRRRDRWRHAGPPRGPCGSLGNTRLSHKLHGQRARAQISLPGRQASAMQHTALVQRRFGSRCGGATRRSVSRQGSGN